MIKLTMELKDKEDAIEIREKIKSKVCLYSCGLVSGKEYRKCKNECDKCFDKKVNLRIEE